MLSATRIAIFVTLARLARLRGDDAVEGVLRRHVQRAVRGRRDRLSRGGDAAHRLGARVSRGAARVRAPGAQARARAAVDDRLVLLGAVARADGAGAPPTARKWRWSARRCCRRRCRSTRSYGWCCCSTTRPTRRGRAQGVAGRCTRGWPAELTAWLAEPRERFARHARGIRHTGRSTRTSPHVCAATTRLRVHRAPAGCARRAAEEVITDHVDRFFADQVLGVLAADFDDVSQALSDGDDEGAIPAPRDAAAASPACLDVPRRADLVRAQALLVAVARGQQGDEPEQLHRPDGPQLRRARDAGGAGARAGGAPRLDRSSRRRLPAHPGCRQHHPAGVLPAPGVRDGAAGERSAGRHPDPVLARSPARRPGWSGCPAPPPTSSTSCTRA